jgi:hypothetical protein
MAIPRSSFAQEAAVVRPDQAKFDEFVAPLLLLDEIFEKYARRGGFVLERNPHRKPGRILRRGSNPVLIVEMFLEPVWFDVPYDTDLPYSFTVSGYYEEPGSNHRLWKLVEVLASGQAVNSMGEHLSALLEEAMTSIDLYTPEHIMKHGSELPTARSS